MRPFVWHPQTNPFPKATVDRFNRKKTIFLKMSDTLIGNGVCTPNNFAITTELCQHTTSHHCNIIASLLRSSSAEWWRQRGSGAAAAVVVVAAAALRQRAAGRQGRGGSSGGSAAAAHIKAHQLSSLRQIIFL